MRIDYFKPYQLLYTCITDIKCMEYDLPPPWFSFDENNEYDSTCI